MKKIHNSQQRIICFKQYSRKKYAAFNSLSKIIKISTLGAACSIIISPVQGQSKGENDSVSKALDLEEVEVVGQKSTLVIDQIPRIVELISAETIQNIPSQSFPDLLGYRSNIDIRQRGQFGTQADVSIRGGSFDHTLILLNGTNLSDPQTGHHSMDIPIDQETISKIEVLNGPSARAIGANAFSGAINIISEPSDKNRIYTSFHFGENNFMRQHVSINLAGKNSNHLLTIGNAISDGYMRDTDFKNHHLYYHGNYALNKNVKSFVQFGYSQKSFGANSFYTPKFPDQYESNKNIFINAGIKTTGEIATKTQVYWRRHYDRFELFREDEKYYNKDDNGFFINSSNDTAGYLIGGKFYPYLYHNYHVTDIFGADFNLTKISSIGKTSIGAALRSENILSNQLGNNLAIPVPIQNNDSLYYTKQGSRNNFEVFVEHAYRNDFMLISAGTMLNWNSFSPDTFYIVPGIDVNLYLLTSLSFIGSYNYTLGMPTFTDLNYQGPANQGNSKLKPYNQHSIEGGFKYKLKDISVKTAVFYTRGNDNIEWVMNDTSFKYTPINVALSENTGFELACEYSPQGKSTIEKLFKNVYIGYTFINTHRNTPEAISKYTNIRQKLVLNLKQQILSRLIISWNVMYKERTGYFLTYNFNNNNYVANNYPATFLIDLRISYSLKKVGFYIEGTNLTDTEYYESGSIPQPGRWIRGGINIKLL